MISTGVMEPVGVDNCGDGGPMNEIIYLKKEIHLVSTLFLLHSLYPRDKDYSVVMSLGDRKVILLRGIRDVQEMSCLGKDGLEKMSLLGGILVELFM